MSVFVKGMQMPTSCVVCPFGLNGFPDEQIVICTRLGRFVGDSKKKPKGIPKDCQLVEVPAHGRLVDIDEVYRVLSEQYRHSTETQHTALREALSRVPIIAEGEDE